MWRPPRLHRSSPRRCLGTVGSVGGRLGASPGNRPDLEIFVTARGPAPLQPPHPRCNGGVDLCVFYSVRSPRPWIADIGRDGYSTRPSPPPSRGPLRGGGRRGPRRLSLPDNDLCSALRVFGFPLTRSAGSASLGQSSGVWERPQQRPMGAVISPVFHCTAMFS